MGLGFGVSVVVVLFLGGWVLGGCWFGGWLLWCLFGFGCCVVWVSWDCGVLDCRFGFWVGILGLWACCIFLWWVWGFVLDLSVSVLGFVGLCMVLFVLVICWF